MTADRPDIAASPALALHGMTVLSSQLQQRRCLSQSPISRKQHSPYASGR